MLTPEALAVIDRVLQEVPAAKSVKVLHVLVESKIAGVK